MLETTRRLGSRRHDRERGTAMVEFAFVVVLFFTLVLSIISFGLILAFNQNMTQAAAEGARAGATAPQGTPSATSAQTATDNAVATFDQECNTGGGLVCTWIEHDCGTDAVLMLDDPAVANCITVGLVYDYDNFPILPKFPILSAFYPSTLTAASSAEVN